MVFGRFAQTPGLHMVVAPLLRAALLRIRPVCGTTRRMDGRLAVSTRSRLRAIKHSGSRGDPSALSSLTRAVSPLVRAEHQLGTTIAVEQPTARTSSLGRPLSTLALVETRRGVAADRDRFRWHTRERTTFWLPSVYRLHGYQPGAVVPAPALSLAHKHPEELLCRVDVLHEALLANRVVVHQQRIVAADGDVRRVLMSARPVVDELGSSEQLRGFLLSVHENQDKVDQIAPSTSSGLSLLIATFAISPDAAKVLVTALRPISAWRHVPLQCHDRLAHPSAAVSAARSRTGCLPLEHLTLGASRTPL